MVLQSLPLELRMYIFQQCTKKDLCNLSLCDKLCRQDVMPILWRDMCIEWKVLANQTPTEGQLKSVMRLDLHSKLPAKHQVTLNDDVLDTFSSVLDISSSKRLRSIKFRKSLAKDGLQLLLEKFPTIESLAFDSVEAVEDTWSLISSFHHLKELSIKYCNVQDEDLVNIINIKSLRKLSIIGCCSLTGQVLAYISQSKMLKHLVIASCEGIDGSDYAAAISQLKEVQNLELFNTKLDEAFCNDALKDLTLKRLNIAWTGVTDTGMLGIENLKSLTDLDISACDITNVALQEIIGLPLRRLNMNCCVIVTNVGLGHVGKIITLQWLNISLINITDEGIKMLVGLKSLNFLRMDHCSLTDNCVDSLLKIPSLKVIGIKGIDFSADGLSRLCKFQLNA